METYKTCERKYIKEENGGGTGEGRRRKRKMENGKGKREKRQIIFKKIFGRMKMWRGVINFIWSFFGTGYEVIVNRRAPHRKAIPGEIKDRVWVKYHGGKIMGRCYCCGEKIEKYNRGWHCSHVLAHAKKGETVVDNLRTCCRKCNLSMGDQNLYVYIKEKKMRGPGSKHADFYLSQHPEQIHDIRTNTWKGARGKALGCNSTTYWWNPSAYW